MTPGFYLFFEKKILGYLPSEFWTANPQLRKLFPFS